MKVLQYSRGAEAPIDLAAVAPIILPAIPQVVRRIVRATALLGTTLALVPQATTTEPVPDLLSPEPQIVRTIKKATALQGTTLAFNPPNTTFSNPGPIATKLEVHIELPQPDRRFKIRQYFRTRGTVQAFNPPPSTFTSTGPGTAASLEFFGNDPQPDRASIISDYEGGTLGQNFAFNPDPLPFSAPENGGGRPHTEHRHIRLHSRVPHFVWMVERGARPVLVSAATGPETVTSDKWLAQQQPPLEYPVDCAEYPSLAHPEIDPTPKVDGDTNGSYLYRAFSTGSGKAAKEGGFNVRSSF